VSGGRDAPALIENCAGRLIKDEKTRQVVSCAAKFTADQEQLAQCAALAILSADTAVYASCAENSRQATSFALCSLGPKMNEEWRIAAACAVQADGNPVAYAECTAGRLTVGELAKCFAGNVGTDCYEPDNTIVTGIRAALRDLVDGTAKNNAIVAAVNKIGQLAGGPNSLVNKPWQIVAGRNSIFHNPNKFLGADNSIFHNPRQIASSIFHSPRQIARMPVGRLSMVYRVSRSRSQITAWSRLSWSRLSRVRSVP
jgi:hypothetical protein